jgi:hypothetical protein
MIHYSGSIIKRDLIRNSIRCSTAFVWSILILQKLFVHFYLYSWQAAAEINRGFCGIVC